MLMINKNSTATIPKYDFIEYDVRNIVQNELDALCKDAKIKSFIDNINAPDDNQALSSDLQYVSAIYRRYYGDVDKAMEHLTKAISLHTSTTELILKAHYFRGILFLYDLNLYSKALKDLKVVSKENMDYKQDIRYNLAVCLFCLAKYKDALSCINNDLSVNQDDFRAYLLRARINEAIMKREKTLVVDSDTQKESYSEILADYDRTISHKPDYKHTYNCRGYFYTSIGRFDSALSDFNKAIELDPDYVKAYFNRAWLYHVKLADFEKAIDDYSKVIEFDNYSKVVKTKSSISLKAAAHNNRGNIYHKKPDHFMALQDYDSAISLNSGYSGAYYNRGVLYQYKIKDYKKALADYSKAISIDPNYIKAYHNRASLYSELGEIEKAAADMEKARELGR
jgi:tetratricopeptide (TPR) repeat protein